MAATNLNRLRPAVNIIFKLFEKDVVTPLGTVKMMANKEAKKMPPEEVRELLDLLDDGNITRFAMRFEVREATIYNWLAKGAPAGPTTLLLREKLAEARAAAKRGRKAVAAR